MSGAIDAPTVHLAAQRVGRRPVPGGGRLLPRQPRATGSPRPECTHPPETTPSRRPCIDLGQLLFFDPELSGNRDVACSSCHLPVDHAGDGLPLGRSEGATGAGRNRHGGHALPRNTPSPFNRSFATALFWDGRIERMPDGTLRAPVALPDGVETPVQAQALMPLITRDEMRGQAGDLDVNGNPNELARIADDDPAAVWDGVMARLMAIPGYRDAFEAAFPDVPAGEHTIAHAVRAIERFEMHLWELTDTPFDRYLGSEESPPNDRELSAEAQRGALLFFGPAGCDRCHDGPLLSDGSYHNIGVFPVGMDEGRFVVTSDPNDRFAFRTPPLRNVALTGPYMHDGAVETLADAIDQHIAPGDTLDQGLTLPDGTPVSIDTRCSRRHPRHHRPGRATAALPQQRRAGRARLVSPGLELRHRGDRVATLRRRAHLGSERPRGSRLARAVTGSA